MKLPSNATGCPLLLLFELSGLQSQAQQNRKDRAINPRRVHNRTRFIPIPRILTMSDVERKLGQQVTADVLRADWLKHRCTKSTGRGSAKRFFALEDVEAVEDRILCGEYPGQL
jgi:hypothetical protein